MTFNTNYSDTGLFGVHVATEKNDALDDVAFAVMREFQKLNLPKPTGTRGASKASFEGVSYFAPRVLHVGECGRDW